MAGTRSPRDWQIEIRRYLTLLCSQISNSSELISRWRPESRKKIYPLPDSSIRSTTTFAHKG